MRIEVKEKINRVWEDARKELFGTKFQGIIDRGYAIEDCLEADESQFKLLFLSLNPSNDGLEKASGKEGIIYSLKDRKALKAQFWQEHFKLYDGVKDVTGLDIPFLHHDLFYVRETDSKRIIAMRNEEKAFMKRQLAATEEIIRELVPDLIVVNNSRAFDIFQEEKLFGFVPVDNWDEGLGVDFLPALHCRYFDKGTPIIFSGMLSGGAMDRGTKRSLQWHICHIIRQVLKMA